MSHVARIFNGVPARYPTGPHQRKRRTATNIMAGCFDPIPLFATAYEMSRHDQSMRRTTPVTAPTLLSNVDLTPTALNAIASPDARLPGTKKDGVSAAKKPRRIVPLIRAHDTSVSLGKFKGTKQAVPVNQENEDTVMSDGESREPHSPPPPFLTHAHEDPVPADLLTVRPKASGFRQDRSSNASDTSPLKRKRSSHISPDNTQPSSPITESPRSKKHRLSDAPASEDHSRVFSSTSSSLASSGSLTSVSEPPELPELSDSYAKKPTASVFEKALPVLSAVEVAKEPQRRTRKKGVRKHVAIRKGWKGWVEDDPAPQKLILLDKPQVLPERITRSGRKID